MHVPSGQETEFSHLLKLYACYKLWNLPHLQIISMLIQSNSAQQRRKLLSKSIRCHFPTGKGHCYPQSCPEFCSIDLFYCFCSSCLFFFYLLIFSTSQHSVTPWSVGFKSLEYTISNREEGPLVTLWQIKRRPKYLQNSPTPTPSPETCFES